VEILLTRRNDLKGMNLTAAPAAALGIFTAFPMAGPFMRARLANSRRRGALQLGCPRRKDARLLHGPELLSDQVAAETRLSGRRPDVDPAWMEASRKTPFLRARIIGYRI
jgi:hypothetical protein